MLVIETLLLNKKFIESLFMIMFILCEQFTVDMTISYIAGIDFEMYMYSILNTVYIVIIIYEEYLQRCTVGP